MSGFGASLPPAEASHEVTEICSGPALRRCRQHVIRNARIIMEAPLSSRTYTPKQLAPLF